jgi:CRISPR-associated endonuclease/helicase Cas3
MLRTGQMQSAGRHWEVTEALLLLYDATELAPVVGGREGRRHALYAATAGHHGRPPNQELRLNRLGTAPGGAWKVMLDAAGFEAMEDAVEVIRVFCGLWPEASLAGLEKDGVEPLSWRLAGLVTAADWIGSNAGWFPPTEAGPGPSDYLDLARSRADAALCKAGLDTPGISTTPVFDFVLRPMQAACEGAPLKTGPMLAIIEDETGAGKTEAADPRTADACGGEGQGALSLPMVTADAMFALCRTEAVRINVAFCRP